MIVENALKRLRDDSKNAEAWQVIAKDAYQPTLAYVASLLLTFSIGAAESADDIVHEVLVRFYERWPKIGGNIESRESLHSYLRTSCRNLLVDRYRRERNARRFVDFF